MKALFKASIILFFLLKQTFSLFAQGEIDNQHKILYRNEKSFSISANTNGFGIGYRYAKHINIHKKWVFEGDANLVKHPKEKRVFNSQSNTTRRFVYGKTNGAFNLRFAAGRQIELYRKADQNSVSIRFLYSGGAALTFLKPIKYLVYQAQTRELEWEYFKKNTPMQYIFDRTSFYQSFENTQMIPGIFLRVATSFEFNKLNQKLNILEIGATCEGYLKRIKIMETKRNSFIIPSLYIAYRFGKVSSGYHLKKIDEGRK